MRKLVVMLLLVGTVGLGYSEEPARVVVEFQERNLTEDFARLVVDVWLENSFFHAVYMLSETDKAIVTRAKTELLKEYPNVAADELFAIGLVYRHSRYAYLVYILGKDTVVGVGKRYL